MHIIRNTIIPSPSKNHVGRPASLPKDELKAFEKDIKILEILSYSLLAAPILGAVIGAAAHKFFPPEHVTRDLQKTQHVMRAPVQTEEYFQSLNKTRGFDCEVQFQDGKKHNSDSLKLYLSVKSLGECARIAFNANNNRKPSDNGISFELNASAARNSYVGRGICDFREKTGLPYCYATTYTDKFFLEYE